MDTKLLFEKALEAGITEIEVYRSKSSASEVGSPGHYRYHSIYSHVCNH